MSYSPPASYEDLTIELLTPQQAEEYIYFHGDLRAQPRTGVPGNECKHLFGCLGILRTNDRSESEDCASLQETQSRYSWASAHRSHKVWEQLEPMRK